MESKILLNGDYETHSLKRIALIIPLTERSLTDLGFQVRKEKYKGDTDSYPVLAFDYIVKGERLISTTLDKRTMKVAYLYNISDIKDAKTKTVLDSVIDLFTRHQRSITESVNTEV